MNVRVTGCSCMVPDDHKPQTVAVSLLGLGRGRGVETSGLLSYICVWVSWVFSCFALSSRLCSSHLWLLASVAYPRFLPFYFFISVAVPTHNRLCDAVERCWVKMCIFSEEKKKLDLMSMTVGVQWTWIWVKLTLIGWVDFRVAKFLEQVPYLLPYLISNLYYEFPSPPESRAFLWNLL